MYTEL